MSAHLAHCTESRIVLKMGQQQKLYPPTDISVPLQCHPQQLSVRFENLVHSIFKNENSSMEINMSYFRVLHWQQWQSLASGPCRRLGLFKTYPKLGFYNNFVRFHVFMRLLVPEISKFLFFEELLTKNSPTLANSQYSWCSSTRFTRLIYAKILSITFFCPLDMKFPFWLLSGELRR